MKALKESINKEIIEGRRYTQYSKKHDEIYDVNLNKYFGLDNWKIVNVESKNVQGDEVINTYNELVIGDEQEYCQLLNVEKPKFADKYSAYDIKPHQKYYIVRIESNEYQPSKETFLAISQGIVMASEVVRQAEISVKEKLKEIEYDIMQHVGYPNYFPKEIYDMLQRLYKADKIADPQSWM